MIAVPGIAFGHPNQTRDVLFRQTVVFGHSFGFCHLFGVSCFFGDLVVGRDWCGMVRVLTIGFLGSGRPALRGLRLDGRLRLHRLGLRQGSWLDHWAGAVRHCLRGVGTGKKNNRPENRDDTIPPNDHHRTAEPERCGPWPGTVDPKSKSGADSAGGVRPAWTRSGTAIGVSPARPPSDVGSEAAGIASLPEHERSEASLLARAGVSKDANHTVGGRKTFW